MAFLCEECDSFFSEKGEDWQARIDGDIYDPTTEFWFNCPNCNATLKEIDVCESCGKMHSVYLDDFH